MKFESLPNELLLECFEYLHIFDLLQSFNRLNLRFHQLIRRLPLHLDLQDIRLTKFLKFCRSISSNPDNKPPIRALCLSNKNQSGQIQKFLSCFSSKQFSHLHSLTLIQIRQENLVLLKSFLPSAVRLFSLHLIHPDIDDTELLAVLPKSNLRKLTLFTLRSFLLHTHQSTLITQLTISHCSLEQVLYQLFQYVPSLKYLYIGCMKKYNRSIRNDTITNVVYLKRLVIGQFNYRLEDFERLAKQTPNLLGLAIMADHNQTMINAHHWEYLIHTFLPRLHFFQFKFTFKILFKNAIISRYRLFYTKFWIKEHSWMSELLWDRKYLYVYTIPYLTNIFKFESKLTKLTQPMIKYGNQFDYVTDLSLNLEEIMNKECSFQFSNVSSLRLTLAAVEPSIEPFPMESLKAMVHLCHVKHLDISTYQKAIVSGELLQILKESPQLSSITLDPNDLILLYKNKELCRYVNLMIRKVNIYKYGHYSFDDLGELKKFCQLFSKIEQLICNINEPKRILFLIYRLGNLTNLHVYLSAVEDRKYFRSLFKKASRKFHLSLRFTATEASIWMDKH